MHLRYACLAPTLLFVASAAAVHAQDSTQPQPLPHVSLHPGAAPQAAAPAATPVPAETTAAPIPSAEPAPVAEAAKQPASAAIPTRSQPAAEPAKASGGLFHKEKVPYTGPTEIVTLPPTPMLDEEGRQRLDLDGKPMFNPPMKQQRDKLGHPLFDENRKPVFQTATELGYDEHGKKLHAEKIKPPKATPVSIARGTFTVDGVIAKAELNYDIPDLKFIYFYVPGMGVTVVSNQAFPGSRQQPDAFTESTLTVKVGEHTLQLASDKRLLDKKPEPAYVLLDRDFRLPSRYPVVGYGTLARAPYQWPGSRANQQLAGTVAAPPIPKNLEPTLLLKPCPAGQMRMPAPRILPGQTAQNQPCVPIAQAQAAAAALKAKVAPITQ